METNLNNKKIKSSTYWSDKLKTYTDTNAKNKLKAQKDAEKAQKDAEKLKEQFSRNGLKVRYFGADRISNLANKWDDVGGQLAYDKTNKGYDIEKIDIYKLKAIKLGQSFDALIELQRKLDLQIKIESILSDLFKKEIAFEEKGGFLNVSITDKKTGNIYDLKKNESHGIKEIITLLTFIYNDEYNCIILDEPELNLHPQFQQFILQEIKKKALTRAKIDRRAKKKA